MKEKIPPNLPTHFHLPLVWGGQANIVLNMAQHTHTNTYI